ncbi:acetyltransferase [Spirochaetia bacterium]|nr:acetyltransferase [Spirochaetia bacterium]
MKNKNSPPPPHANLLIIGTGGQGRVVLDCIKNKYKKIVFFTNDLHSMAVDGYSILFEQETTDEYLKNNFDEIVVAIGNNNARLNLSLKYETKGFKLATIIHPTAVISETAEIGAGTVIFANAVINPNAKIGKACIINTSTVIEHDCILGNGVHISPNAAMGGTVTIGEKTWICVGSSIANNIKIGKNCVIGAGAVVIKDVPNNVLVAGVPAKIKKEYT